MSMDQKSIIEKVIIDRVCSLRCPMNNEFYRFLDYNVINRKMLLGLAGDFFFSILRMAPAGKKFSKADQHHRTEL